VTKIVTIQDPVKIEEDFMSAELRIEEDSRSAAARTGRVRHYISDVIWKTWLMEGQKAGSDQTPLRTAHSAQRQSKPGLCHYEHLQKTFLHNVKTIYEYNIRKPLSDLGIHCLLLHKPGFPQMTSHINIILVQPLSTRATNDNAYRRL